MAKDKQQNKNLSHVALKKWAKNALGRNAKPVTESDTCKLEFTFEADGHYELSCLFIAQEPLSMLTVSGSAFLAIPKSKEKKILAYCDENSTGVGLFSVIEGALVYIHSLSVDADTDGVELINSMMFSMDEAVSAVAEGVLELLKSKRGSAKS